MTKPVDKNRGKSVHDPDYDHDYDYEALSDLYDLELEMQWEDEGREK